VSCGRRGRRARARGRLVGTILVLVLLVFGSAGCGADPDAASPSLPLPTPRSQPAAVRYADVEALFSAVEAAGSPVVEGLTLGPDRGYFADSSKGTFLVASPDGTLALTDGTPATNVVAAVFPDEQSLARGLRFGGRMAAGLGWPSVLQLRGPGWLIWGIEAGTMRAVRAAIGGRLSRVPATPESADPQSSA